MEREIAHELILVIANQGHTDQVMEAARGAGATGRDHHPRQGDRYGTGQKVFRRLYRL